MSKNIKKMRYSAQHMPPVRQTYRSTAAARPYTRRELKRFQAGDDDASGSTGLDAATIALLVAAISNTDEMQYIRKLMAEQNNDAAGGEVAAEEPTAADPLAEYEEKSEAYRRAGRVDSEALHYQQPSPAERYAQRQQSHARRQEAHASACVAFEKFNASRKSITEKAAQHALLTGTDYTTALRAVGGSVPDVKLLPAAVHA